jgi:hypothetical protein
LSNSKKYISQKILGNTEWNAIAARILFTMISTHWAFLNNFVSFTKCTIFGSTAKVSFGEIMGIFWTGLKKVPLQRDYDNDGILVVSKQSSW